MLRRRGRKPKSPHLHRKPTSAKKSVSFFKQLPVNENLHRPSYLTSSKMCDKIKSGNAQLIWSSPRCLATAAQVEVLGGCFFTQLHF